MMCAALCAVISVLHCSILCYVLPVAEESASGSEVQEEGSEGAECIPSQQLH
jgi:hypothetical protein